MSWLGRLFSSGEDDAKPEWSVGDQIWSDGESWQVTAMVGYTSGAARWRTYKLTRGSTSIWITSEAAGVTRYDSLPDVRVDDGRATWNGREYERTESGSITITDVTGDVDGAPGDHAQYETLSCAADESSWISVERWVGGRTEVSAGRTWRIDRTAPGPGRADR